MGLVLVDSQPPEQYVVGHQVGVSYRQCPSLQPLSILNPSYNLTQNGVGPLLLQRIVSVPVFGGSVFQHLHIFLQV